jgi:hypothetical protein
MTVLICCNNLIFEYFQFCSVGDLGAIITDLGLEIIRDLRSRSQRQSVWGALDIGSLETCPEYTIH